MKYLHIKEILLFILCPRTVQFYFVSYIILIDGSTSLNVKQMKDKIIYIDEFECFSNNLTHNKNLDNNIRLINNLLMKLIKNCHKLIISDALINNGVKIFLHDSKSKRKNSKS